MMNGPLAGSTGRSGRPATGSVEIGTFAVGIQVFEINAGIDDGDENVERSKP